MRKTLSEKQNKIGKINRCQSFDYDFLTFEGFRIFDVIQSTKKTRGHSLNFISCQYQILFIFKACAKFRRLKKIPLDCSKKLISFRTEKKY